MVPEAKALSGSLSAPRCSLAGPTPTHPVHFPTMKPFPSARITRMSLACRGSAGGALVPCVAAVGITALIAFAATAWSPWAERDRWRIVPSERSPTMLLDTRTGNVWRFDNGETPTWERVPLGETQLAEAEATLKSLATASKELVDRETETPETTDRYMKVAQDVLHAAWLEDYQFLCRRWDRAMSIVTEATGEQPHQVEARLSSYLKLPRAERLPVGN